MTRTVLRWLESPWALELVPGINKLGRNPSNDLRISDPSVSSFHAEMMVEKGQIRVRDLGSTNGTFVDDIRVSEAVVTPEHVLRLGNVRLRIEEVGVIPVSEIPTMVVPRASVKPASVTVGLSCAHHPGARAAYRCANCGGGYCVECITVMGQSKFGATTLCPVCNGQCHPLPQRPEEEAPESGRGFFGRLTQTLKIPFSR